MTDAPIFRLPVDEAAGPAWRLRTVVVRIDGERRVLRLVRFERGWLASADSVVGPTLGHDASPYLAARRALEPLGVGTVEAMTAIGGLEGLAQAEPGSTGGQKSSTARSEAATSSSTTDASPARRMVV